MSRHDQGWWAHVPAHQRLSRRAGVGIHRLLDAIRRRSFVISALVCAYAFVCVGLLLSGTGAVALLAALPLLLVPPVALLAYWLLWKEFHH